MVNFGFHPQNLWIQSTFFLNLWRPQTPYFQGFRAPYPQNPQIICTLVIEKNIHFINKVGTPFVDGICG